MYSKECNSDLRLKYQNKFERKYFCGRTINKFRDGREDNTELMYRTAYINVIRIINFYQTV